MSTAFYLPPLYPILDAETCARKSMSLFEVAKVWADAGVQIVQYRDKNPHLDTVLSNTLRLREIFDESGTRLVMNDSAELAREAGLDTVHVGQEDDLVYVAKTYVPYVGISTHDEAQVIAAEASEAAYVAIGPVFATSTKANASPVVGIAGVARARALTKKPLVAIGGITLERIPAVLAAGADSVAVVSALLEGDPEKTIRTFLDAAKK